jgi:hypothetical protein
MLFLLNDVVFRLDALSLAPPVTARRFRRVSLGFVRSLGRELFAEQPLLQYGAPERAKRLAALIAAKAPSVNAALFVAPTFDCDPALVSVRFAEISFEVMVGLYLSQRAGRLTNVTADRQVWRRLAA